MRSLKRAPAARGTTPPPALGTRVKGPRPEPPPQELARVAQRAVDDRRGVRDRQGEPLLRQDRDHVPREPIRVLLGDPHHGVLAVEDRGRPLAVHDEELAGGHRIAHRDRDAPEPRLRRRAGIAEQVAVLRVLGEQDLARVPVRGAHHDCAGREVRGDELPDGQRERIERREVRAAGVERRRVGGQAGELARGAAAAEELVLLLELEAVDEPGVHELRQRRSIVQDLPRGRDEVRERGNRRVGELERQRGLVLERRLRVRIGARAFVLRPRVVAERQFLRELDEVARGHHLREQVPDHEAAHGRRHDAGLPIRRDERLVVGHGIRRQDRRLHQQRARHLDFDAARAALPVRRQGVGLGEQVRQFAGASAVQGAAELAVELPFDGLETFVMRVLLDCGGLEEVLQGLPVFGQGLLQDFGDCEVAHLRSPFRIWVNRSRVLAIFITASFSARSSRASTS